MKTDSDFAPHLHFEIRDLGLDKSIKDSEEKTRVNYDQLLSNWRENLNKEVPLIVEDDVAYTVARMTGIPLFKIEEKESDKLIRMEEFLHEHIVAQHEDNKKSSASTTCTAPTTRFCIPVLQALLLNWQQPTTLLS